jgi:hypothetical protein
LLKTTLKLLNNGISLKVAIISKSGYSSPKVLALGLQNMLSKLGHSADILEIYESLARAFPVFSKTRYKTNWHYRIRQKLFNYYKDVKAIRSLRGYDLFIFCECTPNGFWKGYYNVEYLRKLYPDIPFAYYEVYYLGNAPSHLNKLIQQNDFGLERYNWHFSVSNVTEITQEQNDSWSSIGLDLTFTGLKVCHKEKFSVLVDFVQPGYEELREEQIQLLTRLNIPYISLERRYTFDEIREIYKQSAILLIQSSETFGIPIAECLSTGCAIATPTSAWPMAWRKGSNLMPDGYGELPDCFIIYNDIKGLETKLKVLKDTFDSEITPQEVFKSFYNNYPFFYEGDLNTLSKSLKSISK